MTLTQDKKNRIWKARVKTLDGTIRTLSTGVTDKTAAKEIVRRSNLLEIEEAAKAGKLTTKGINAILGSKKVTVPAAAESFLKALEHNASSPIYVQQAKGVLTRFITHQGLTNTLIPDVTEEHVYAFVNEDNGTGATWRRTQLSILRSLLTLAVHREWRTGNPAKLVHVQMHKLRHKQKETKPRRPFTDREIEKILAMLTKEMTALEKDLDAHPEYVEAKVQTMKQAIYETRFWYSAIVIGRYTGLRLGDVAQMEHDCFAQPRKITVWTDKRDKRVVLPLQPALLKDALADIPPVSMTYLFPEHRDIYLDPNRRANLSTYFRRICERAGIEGKTFHDLRASFLSDAARRGVPIEHIAQSAGHSSTKTTRGYIKPMD